MNKTCSFILQHDVPSLSEKWKRSLKICGSLLPWIPTANLTSLFPNWSSLNVTLTQCSLSVFSELVKGNLSIHFLLVSKAGALKVQNIPCPKFSCPFFFSVHRTHGSSSVHSVKQLLPLILSCLQPPSLRYFCLLNLSFRDLL